jgi:alkylation response protein AidB-like acyl-CoA dehydrogenase
MIDKDLSAPAAAQQLIPVLAAEAPHSERLRRLSDASADALRTAGMFRLTTPRKYGGFELDVRTSLQVTAELARGDGAAAWIAMVMTGGSFIAGLLSDDVRAHIWGSDPDIGIAASLTPAGTAVRLADGVRATGTWHWASGIDHATWVALAMPVLDDDGALLDQVVALVPVADLTVKDTWHAAGLSGTGTNSAVADRVFIPADRVLSLPAALAGAYSTGDDSEPLYRTSISSFMAITVVGPMLGLARAALDTTLAVAARKPMSLTTHARIADSPSAQLAFADAASLVDTAELHAWRGADDLDRAARENRSLDVAARARIRMDTGVAATAARKAVDLLLSVAGASSFALSDPLQRIWRDLGIASRHGVVNPHLARELYGRSLLGFADQPAFII